MEIEVIRTPGTKDFTGGNMLINGVRECFTLEDEVREVEGVPVSQWKIPKVTAIPRGRYRCVISHSNRFDVEMPELLNVPGYSGVRIHPLNTAKETDGCIGVGDENPSDGFMGESRNAYKRVFEKISNAIAHGDQVWVTVK